MNYTGNSPFRHQPFLWNIIFLFTLVVYAVGLFIPIMEPDAAVYAQVSMEMALRDDYLSIYHKGVDWLDKPHFPFWMSAFSYELFGVNTFAYKLPAIVFVLLGALYTFLFGKRFYSPLHGWVAALILLTAEHIFISNQDVRAEPFMTGLLIMSLYHFVRMLQSQGSRYWLHMMLGSLAAACLIMTKGLFTVIPVAAGVGLGLIYRRDWKNIFHWQWIAALVLLAVFLTPSLIGYYRQFDLHPEKTVFGERGVSGVEFFLWTSQWGRFTNTGPIKGKGDLSFFVHTMLWAYLPWAFAAFFALFSKTKELIRNYGKRFGNNMSEGGEPYTFFGFITLFLIFSVSRFQLSFYLNPLFPLLSIVTAAALLKQGSRTLKTFSMIHLVLAILLTAGLVSLHIFFDASIPSIDTWVLVLAGLAGAFYLFFTQRAYLTKILYATALVVVSVNYYLNREFYPALLKYQAESEAAYDLRQMGVLPGQVLYTGEMQSVADVILGGFTNVVETDRIDVSNASGKYVFVDLAGQHRLDSLKLRYEVLNQYDDFPVTRLNGKFINPATREKEVSKKFLLKVEAATNTDQ